MFAVQRHKSSELPSLNDLKDAFLAFPNNRLLSDFLIMTASSERQETPSFEALLSNYGFGHLVDADFFNLWGTSWNEVMQTDEYPVQRDGLPAKSHRQVSDIRVFTGYYVVTKPAFEKGEHFLIHPMTGAIHMAGHELTPQEINDV